MTDSSQSPSRPFTRFFSSVASFALLFACLRNVFLDGDVVERMAAVTACEGKPGCHAQMTRIMRTPIGHSYRFMVAGHEVLIECMREYVLAGDYACKDKSSTLDSPAPPAASVPAPSAAKPRK